MKLIGLLISLFCLPGLLWADESSRWDELKPAFFGDKIIVEGTSVISVEAPVRAADAAVVPIQIVVNDASAEIRRMHLVVDQNPLPLAGVFDFGDAGIRWHSLETRIRINEYTPVRAIAELADGSLHMNESFVKASGGCSAPALSDLEAALANAGKMRVYIDGVHSGGSSSGQVGRDTRQASAEAVIKISHPNNSGMQFDQISRNYIPAFFVSKIVAQLDGKEVLNVDTNFSMSENPVVRLNFDADVNQGEFLVYAIDSKGNRYEQSENYGSSVLQ